MFRHSALQALLKNFKGLVTHVDSGGHQSRHCGMQHAHVSTDEYDINLDSYCMGT